MTCTSETLLPKLTERMAHGWTKLGAAVGAWDGRATLSSLNFPDPSSLLDVAERSLRENATAMRVFPGGHSSVAIPIRIAGRTAGAMLCQLPPMSADKCEGLLEAFTRHFEDLHVHHQNEDDLTALSRELSGSYEELNLIYRLGDAFAITDDPEQFVARFADDLLELIDARQLLLLMTRRTRDAETFISAGQPVLSRSVAISACRYLLDRIGTSREPVIFSGLDAHPSLVRLFGQTETNLLAQPLRSGEKTLAILVAIGTQATDQFDSTHAKLFGSIVERTSSFLQNRSLVADLQELLSGLLTSLVSAIDAKDPYTRGHSQRVGFIGQRIAESLGLTKKQCAQVYMAGLLHDIGKIGINDHVLGKPGKLTPEEFATVQQHPVIGSRIISSIHPLRSILPAVLHHHERYDGKGYCEGLIGEQIPLMGMIVGLADAFDAITSRRTYHEAMGFKDAVSEVVRCSGKQFSPTVVKGLLDCGLDKLETELHALADQNGEIPILPNLCWLE